MNTLLVTGGAGFIGSNFIHYWMKKYPEDTVLVLDALTYAGNYASICQHETSDRFRFIQGDICDAPLVKNMLEKETVNKLVHFAAETHVDRSITGPDPFIQTNVVGTHTLLKTACDVWNKSGCLDKNRFHHISTDEVYGSLGESDQPFAESTPYHPNSPYSASKAASDHLVRAWHHTYGMNVTISNCSNNYGPYHYPEKLIPLTILNILHGKPIPVYGDGKNIRDWLYVDDHCRAIDLILQNGKTGETYNIGGLCERTNIDVVKIICMLMDRMFSENPAYHTLYPACPAANTKSCASLIAYVQDRPGHDWRYAMNIDKISSRLDFKLQESFESGIEKTLRWYLDNRDWWMPVTGQRYQEWLQSHYSR